MLLFIKMVFLAQEGHSEYLNKYFTQMTLDGAPRDTLVSLQNKGIINQSYKIPEKGSNLNPLDIEFNKTFIKSYLQHSHDMGMELFMIYPSSIVIKQRTYSLRNIAKHYKSLEDFAFSYGKTIKFDINKHNQVLELLEWGKNNNLITCGIVEFVVSQKWIELQEWKESGNVIGEIDNIALL